MDGLQCIDMAQKHLEEMKKRINEDNFEDFVKEIQEVTSAMFYLWDWLNVKQNNPY